MKKNIEKLVEKFKKVESELVEILSEKGVFVDENEQKSIVKKTLKEYIKKVNKAKKLFDEYELLAKEIENIDSDDEDLPELSKAVLEMRDSSEINLEKFDSTDKASVKKSKKERKIKETKKENMSVKEF